MRHRPLPHAVAAALALVLAGCGADENTTPATPPAAQAPEGRPLGPATTETAPSVPHTPGDADEPHVHREEDDAPIPDTPDGAAPPPTAKRGSGSAWRAMAKGPVSIDREVVCRQAGFDSQEQRYLVVCSAEGLRPDAIERRWLATLRKLEDVPENYTVAPRGAPAQEA